MARRSRAFFSRLMSASYARDTPLHCLWATSHHFHRRALQTITFAIPYLFNLPCFNPVTKAPRPPCLLSVTLPRLVLLMR
jgi:hypothetical protein